LNKNTSFHLILVLLVTYVVGNIVYNIYVVLFSSHAPIVFAPFIPSSFKVLATDFVLFISVLLAFITILFSIYASKIHRSLISLYLLLVVEASLRVLSAKTLYWVLGVSIYMLYYYPWYKRRIISGEGLKKPILRTRGSWVHFLASSLLYILVHLAFSIGTAIVVYDVVKLIAGVRTVFPPPLPDVLNILVSTRIGLIVSALISLALALWLISSVIHPVVMALTLKQVEAVDRARSEAIDMWNALEGGRTWHQRVFKEVYALVAAIIIYPVLLSVLNQFPQLLPSVMTNYYVFFEGFFAFLTYLVIRFIIRSGGRQGIWKGLGYLGVIGVLFYVVMVFLGWSSFDPLKPIIGGRAYSDPLGEHGVLTSSSMEFLVNTLNSLENILRSAIEFLWG